MTLKAAIRVRDLALVRTLARAADGESAYNAGLLALEVVRKGDVEILNALLDGGVDVDFSDDLGWTPLMAAAAAGRVEAVLDLLDRGAELDRTAGKERTTALRLAASEGHLEVVEDLIDVGAAVDEGVLWAAAEGGARDVVDFLTPRFPAEVVERARKELAASLRRRKKQVKLDPRSYDLMEAITLGHHDKVRRLLDRGVDPDGADEEDVRPLGSAVRVGDAASIRLLVERGANPDLGDCEDGDTPLMWAVQLHSDSMVRLLIELGAGLGPRNKAGKTALELAAKLGLPDIVRMLLDAGAHPLGKPPEAWVGSAWYQVVWRMRMAREGPWPDEFLDESGDAATFADRGVATLLSALRQGDGRARRGAVELLGRLGTLARDAEPALVALADDCNDWVRRAVKRALQSIRAG